MRVMIVEDEPPARERLTEMVRAWDPAVVVEPAVGSLAEARAALAAQPDLVLLDVQLADGLGLDLLPDLSCPVVMVTAWDEYVMQALAEGCIDYLLKPVRAERLHAALDKYLKLRAHFDLAKARSAARPRTRIVARKGADFVALPVTDVAYFFSEHKLVFARDRAGAQYLGDRPLAALEAELDPQVFFRLNRRVVAHVSAIRRFRPGEKGRIQVALEPPAGEPVLVSQERAPAFREWIGR